MSAAKVRIVNDTDLDVLPRNGAVWLFGWDNQHLASIKSLFSAQGVRVTAKTIKLKGKSLARADRHVVLTTQAGGRKKSVVVLLATDDPRAISSLARKLPHYSKYGYLAFNSEGMRNVLKGQWPASRSPLRRILHKEVIPASLVPPTPRAPLSVVRR